MRKAIMIILAGLFLSACTKVKIDETGVRINNYGPDKGVVSKDFAPGYHIKLANMHTWHYFPSTVQTHAMTKNAAFRNPTDRGPLQMRTADGFDILLDVYVYYKIIDGQAHLLLEDLGGGERYKDIVTTISVDGCIAVFGTMLTEDFYSSAKRRDKLTEARVLMNRLLKDRNLEIIDVLILDVEFDPKYEQIIKEKKLSDQRVLLNQSEERLAAQKGITDKIVAETEGHIKLIQQQTQAAIDSIKAEAGRQSSAIIADASKYSSEKRAIADLVYKQKTAQGTEALRTSEARAKQLITKSLAGRDGQNVAALEAVRNLKVKEIIFSSYDQDWLDVVNMAKRMSGEKRGSGR